MTRAKWSVVAVLGVLSAVGCDSGGSTDVDMSGSALCTAPNATTCIDNHTKAFCNEAAVVTLTAPCTSGQICEGGECKADPAVACSESDNTCSDDMTAMRCTSAHKGFDVVTCPANTKCSGKGLCVGKCVVGSGFCSSNGTLSVCMDGQSYTTSTCDAGKACVYTKGSTQRTYDNWSGNPLPPDPTAVAECKPSDCVPDRYLCNTVCGNKLDPAAANQDKSTSTCTQTPDGWKWIVNSCGTSGSCVSDTTYDCAISGQQKTCGTACKPGEQVCTDALNYVTCGADGQWATTPTACNAGTGEVKLACATNPADATKIQCADFACQNGGRGACDAAGLFHACGTDGKLAATGTACATGVCVSSGSNQPGGLTPGSCVAQCLAGEERCAAASGQGSTYQVCTNGLWGAVQNCASNDACFQYNTPGSPQLRKKLCGGVCAPGAKRCSDMAGAQVSSGADHYFQTCGADGKWAAAVDCTVGSCNSDPGNPSVIGCLADCVPGGKVCMGSNVTVPNTPYTGTTMDGTCTANGRRPASGTACAANTYCRMNQADQSLGCVACVGGQNEFGLPDTKCGDASGNAGTTNVFKCQANSSGWDIAGTLACAAPNAICHGASTNVQPPQTTGTYCHSEPNIFGSNAPPLTQSFLQSGWNRTCQNNYWSNWGFPMQCGLQGGGIVADCCSSHCYADDQPTPAYCGQ